MRAKLTTQSIDQAVEDAGRYLDHHKTDSKDLIRIRFGIEETLLFYQSAFGTDAEFIMEQGASFGRKKIRLIVPGKTLDPNASPDYSTDEDQFMRMALVRMGQLPKWSYQRGANVVVFTPKKKKMPDWQRLVLAIIGAVVCGVLVRYLPAEVGTLLLEEIVTPLINCFLGFLNAVAGPMIFLSVVWGIYSIGDTTTFNVMGKRLGSRYALYLLLLTVLMAAACLPFIGLGSGSTQGEGGFSSLYRMILDIIPQNLFTPFSRGNTLQILFLAIVIGISMLVIGKETHAVADLSEQLGFIVNGIMNVVSMLVPAFVFGSLFCIVASSDFSALVGGGIFFFATALGCVVVMLIHTAITCFRIKISPLELWKKTASTFVIAITTASSAAAFSDNINTCTKQLGISRKLANFGVPFGQILYKPGVSVLFWFAAVSAAMHAGVQISLVWIVTAVVMSIILSAAAPPVPGGMSASFSILFIQLGLPTEELAITLSLTAILDFIVTATNIFSEQCVLTVVSREISFGE